MPTKTIAVKIETLDDEHCSNSCEKLGVYIYNKCDEYKDFLQSDSMGYLRTSECKTAEIKEKVCKWKRIERYGHWALSCKQRISPVCDKPKYCPYCGRKVE